MVWSDVNLASQKVQNKQFPSVDIMKLICAILVVSIHTEPFREVSGGLNYALSNCIARIAVPFFFIAAGYFCFRKTELQNFEKRIPLVYAQRIFKLYLIWIVIYSPQICYSALTYEGGIIRGILKSIHTLFVSGYVHLWYLLALTISIIIIAIALNKRICIEKIVSIGCFLYIIGLLGESYFGLLRPLKGTILWEVFVLYSKVFQTTRNALFVGVLFVGGGALLAYKKIEIGKEKAFFCFLISLICLFIEAFLLRDLELARGNNCYLFLVPTAFFLFYITSHIEIKESEFTKLTRTYSILLYFTHNWINFPIIDVINRVIGKMAGIPNYEMHSLSRFGLVLMGTLLVSYMIIHLQNNKSFRWLRKIY